ncbi:hypothetical protein H0H93_015044 [Arthromyces matolae]|nr:hypothetical protein H0H93_015044 [Arthromyces matolae]
MSALEATIHIDPARVVDEVDPRIYSGFTEHMGRCIYGGLYEPENQHGLIDPKTGFRLDTLEALRDLKIPVVRYPGGIDAVATTYYPLQLFSTLMRGAALNVHVSSPFYDGVTVPKFVQDLEKHTPEGSKLTKYVDVSAVLVQEEKEIRVALVNRDAEQSFKVPIKFGPDAQVSDLVTVHEVWSEDIKTSNTFGDEKVKTVVKEVKWEGEFELKKHSFQDAFL